uniref:Saposin B-type domain-containing protein n=1 Tax=Steinernema glaseri TaxID=37863 RepID=A0A1I8AD07_9BILA
MATSRFRVFLIAIMLITFALSLTPDEYCRRCQHTLGTVYAHFGGRVPGKRVTLRQLEHQCKRQPPYRRRCLLLMRPNIEMLYAEMKASDFKPIWCCERMKECSKNQSPLVDSLSSALELTSSEIQ